MMNVAAMVVNDTKMKFVLDDNNIAIIPMLIID